MLQHLENICPVCVKPLKNLIRVKEHLTIHLNIRLFSCQLCNKAFRRVTTFHAHMRKVHRKEPYKCNRGETDSHRLNCSTQRGPLEGKEEDQLLTSANTVPLDTQQQEMSFNILQDSESSEPAIVNAVQPTLPQQPSKEDPSSRHSNVSFNQLLENPSDASSGGSSQAQNKDLNVPSTSQTISSEGANIPSITVGDKQNLQQNVQQENTSSEASSHNQNKDIIEPSTSRNISSEGTSIPKIVVPEVENLQQNVQQENLLDTSCGASSQDENKDLTEPCTSWDISSEGASIPKILVSEVENLQQNVQQEIAVSRTSSPGGLQSHSSAHEPLTSRMSTQTTSPGPEHRNLQDIETALSSEPSDSEERSKELKCFRCNEIITTVEEGLEHYKRHFKVKPVDDEGDESDREEDADFLCSLCSKPFGVGGSAIVEHILLHWPHKCNSCERRFSDDYKFNQHQIQLCNGVKQKCPLCDHGPSNPERLSRHLRRHIQNICPVCGDNFPSPIELKMHLTSHLNIYPFSCKLCNKAYTNSRSLSKHIMTFHRRELFKYKREQFNGHLSSSSSQSAPIKRKKVEERNDQLEKAATTVSLSMQQQEASNILGNFTSCEPAIINTSSGVQQQDPKNVTFSRTTANASFQGYSSTLRPSLPKTPQNMKSALSEMRSEVVKCYKCNEIITTVEEGLEHHKLHFGLKKVRSQTLEGGVENEETEEYDKEENACYLCTLCEEPLGFGSAIVEHLLLHWPHKCDRCERRYLSTNKLHRHKQECTGKTRKCPLCHKGSIYTAKHPEHMLQHLENICPVCVKPLLCLTRVKEHLTSHLNIRPFSCKLCDATFISSGPLSEHTRTVHMKEPLKCTRCDKTFPARRKLQRHRKICKEEGVNEVKGCNTKQFQCDSCKKLFRRKELMALHIKTVCYKALFRNVQCNQCNFWGYSTFWLNFHKKNRHSEGICEICGKTVKKLQKHMGTHLGSLKKWKCADCGDSFRQKQHLQVHMRKHTGERPYQCEECGDRFKTVGHLINHRETHKPLSERRRVVRRNAPVTRAPKS